MEQHFSTPESTGVPVAAGLTSDITACIPPEQLRRICQDVAQNIAKVLLGDVQQIVEDIRRQYKDHNQLLARQEMALQNLMGRVTTNQMPLSTKTHQEPKTGFSTCGLCLQDAGSLGVEGQRDNSSHEVFMIEGPPSAGREGLQVGVRVSENPIVEQKNWRESKEARQTRRKKTAQEVQSWVAKKLKEQVAPMSPRPSPPPPPPHPYPHREETPQYNMGNELIPEVIPEDRPDPLEEGPTSEVAGMSTAAGSLSPNRASGPASNPPMRPSTGDADEYDRSSVIVPVQPQGVPVIQEDDFQRSRPVAHSASQHSCASESLGYPIRRANVREENVVKPRTSVVGGHDKLFGDMGMDKSQLDKEEYNVAQYYYDTGWPQAIARSDMFANLTLLVIFCNALYIGYDADANDKDNLLQADVQFQVCENTFCVFFTLEWLVRLLAFRYKRDCVKDMWFKFDTVLVLMMVVETWVLPVALSGGTGIPSGLVKLVRLLRLARMARLMRAFPELLAMIKGVKVASRAVSSALLMLIGLVYVFAIIQFTLLKDETNKAVSSRFRRLGLTMSTLLIDGTFLDGIGFVSRSLMDTNHYFPLCVLILFVLLSALTVMNMLIGVLCEVVSAVAAAEKEDSAIRMVKDKLLTLLRELDEDGSGEISREEIQQVMDNGDALAVLENLQVDVHHLMDQLDMFFEEGGDLTIQQIMDLILMLRGDRANTLKDTLHFMTFNRWKQDKAFDELKRLILVLSTAIEMVELDGSSRPSGRDRTSELHL